MERRAPPPPRGLLRRGPPDGDVEHARLLPAAELADHVAHLWWVRWALRRPFVTETLPHPSVHLIFELGRGRIAGVATGRFTRRLVGDGRVIGVKFRPAAFQPVLGAALARLTDRVVPLRAVFGVAAREVTAAVSAAPTLAAAIPAIEAFLRPHLAPLPAEVVALRDLVERLAVDRTLVRVEDVAALAGLDVRTLQRRFRHFVGVTPRWVVQRYRLHEAAARLAGPTPPDLAALAVELGFFDQPHFVRAFKAVVGRPPGQFGRMERPAAATVGGPRRQPR